MSYRRTFLRLALKLNVALPKLQSLQRDDDLRLLILLCAETECINFRRKFDEKLIFLVLRRLPFQFIVLLTFVQNAFCPRVSRMRKTESATAGEFDIFLCMSHAPLARSQRSHCRSVGDARHRFVGAGAKLHAGTGASGEPVSNRAT